MTGRRKPPIVRTYETQSYRPLREWGDVAALSLAYDMNGAATATIALPRTSSNLNVQNIAPLGEGVYVEIDARDLGSTPGGDTVGVPDVWWGRAASPQAAYISPTCAVQCTGPRAWLDHLPVATQAPSAEASTTIAQRLLEQLPASRVELAPIGTRGGGGRVELGGASLWGTLTSMAERRGEEFDVECVPGECRGLLWWRHPLESRVTDVTLIEGENCDWDTAYDLLQTAQTLTGVARSFAAGDGVVGASVSAPRLASLGRKAALEATVTSRAARVLTAEGGEALMRPDIPGRAELETALGNELRQRLVPPLLLQVEILDPALWLKLRAGDIVQTRINDPLGVYARAQGRVLDRAYNVWPSQSMTISLELWDDS